ncbi:DUF5666 domain-containing protein [Spirillospora albida]|uniref:DUF5666 domain-containing protein n=1 Tax=Spirillospora albida TaxID=58123 RepID=UPI0004BF94B2|nr:DUF5666 domain-containing protein [Spirillospora albida]
MKPSISKAAVVLVAGAMAMGVPAAAEAAPKAKDAKSKTVKVKKAKKPKKATPVTAVGGVTVVDGDAKTFTFRVKAGHKSLRGDDVVVTVTSTTKIVKDGAKREFGVLSAGDVVTVKGLKKDGGLAASRVSVHEVETEPAE